MSGEVKDGSWTVSAPMRTLIMGLLGVLLTLAGVLLWNVATSTKEASREALTEARAAREEVAGARLELVEIKTLLRRAVDDISDLRSMRERVTSLEQRVTVIEDRHANSKKSGG